MKSLAELEAIRQKTLEKVAMRKEGSDEIRVVVGMATCGIAAGARPVMLKFVEEVRTRNLNNVTVSQTGCIGMCRLEPMVDVYPAGQGKGYLREGDPGDGQPYRGRAHRERPCCDGVHHRRRRRQIRIR